MAVAVGAGVRCPREPRCDARGSCAKVGVARELCQRSKILSTHSFVCGARQSAVLEPPAEGPWRISALQGRWTKIAMSVLQAAVGVGLWR